eukprot:m.67484 g.67484  ORF g.67484 m.67484 type:complete len:295 (-) comp11892_c0_seq2:124-1008(-)
MEENGDSPDKKPFVRHNGWGPPFHHLQVTAWVLLIFIGVTNFAILIPNLPSQWRSPALSIASVLYATFVTLYIVCTTLDPADFNVKYARDAKAKQFDRAQRPHVIMGGHCYICDVQVGSKSKHCGVCNKCVSEFDHHCIWINNCVGSRNYKLFFGMISTGLLTSCTVFLIVVVLIQKYVRENNKEYTAFNGPISSNGFIALVALIGLLVLAACFLLAHLVGYHVWLNLKGLSTYDHVMLLRARQKSANNKPENSNNEHRSIKTSGQKRNRVAPATDTQPMELESGLNVLPPIKR